MKMQKRKRILKQSLRIFLISILIGSLVTPAFGLTIEDSDWKKLQTEYTNYKAGYNRTIFNYNTLVTTYTNDRRSFISMIGIYSNENKELRRLIKYKNTELLMEKIEKYGLLVAILIVIASVFKITVEKK